MSPRGSKIDRQATADAKFADKRSFVSIKGQRFLRGKDVSDVRAKVMNRVRILGTYYLVCPLCGHVIHEEYAEMDHIIAKGQGGSDDEDNLQIVCGPCHRAKHVQLRFGTK